MSFITSDYLGSSLDSYPDCGAYEFHPLIVGAITGDESVCLGDFGLWTVDVSGGTENYSYQWYVQGEPYQFPHYYDYDPSCYWDSNEGSWNAGDAGVYLTVNDGETIVVVDPFFFEITYCRKEGGDSLQLYPNPASEYITVDIIDENDTDKIFTGPAIQLNESKKKNDYTYAVIDRFGTVLLQKKTYEKHFTISTSSFKTGLYHLQVTSSKGKTDKQFIVVH